MTDHFSAIQKAVGWLKEADGLLISAGAGMGVDSGLPDFRGNVGLWNAYPALGRASMDFAEIASAQTFMADPRLSWGFYGHRLLRYRETVPHEGFSILKRIADQMEQGAFIFTSNVDGQFQKAGFRETQICECHGSIHHLQCACPCIDRIWPAAELEPVVNVETCRLLSQIPCCDTCGGLARPNILMFDDWTWINHRVVRQRQKLDAWLESVTSPVIIEIGAGQAICTVRCFSESRGYPLIRINPREPKVPSGQCVGLPMGALDGLKLLEQALEGNGSPP